MESISLKTSSPLMAMTTAAVKVLLTFLTSLTVDCCLSAAALVCVILWMISEPFVNQAAAATILWVLHFAAMSAIDIHRKGGEL